MGTTPAPILFLIRFGELLNPHYAGSTIGAEREISPWYSLTE